MAEINPYQAPQAHVADTPPSEGHLVEEPKSVDSGRGLTWLSEGWGLFRQAPAIWIAITLIAGVVFILLGMIPLLGQLVSPLLSVVVAGGIMIGCRALDRGEPLTVAHLFAGFQSHLTPLLVVGALYLAGMFVIVLVAAAFTGGAAFALWSGSPGVGTAIGSMLLVIFIVLFLMIPLLMALWFAPALVTLHDVPPVEAMKRSVRGCLRNLLTFIILAVIVMILGVLASIPFALGWLVLLPVLAGASYASYRDVFLA